MLTVIIKTFIDPDVLGKATFPMIVVYYNPSDFPNMYVARMFDTNKPTPYLVVGDSLKEVRNLIPDYMFCQARANSDDPCIVEVWF